LLPEERLSYNNGERFCAPVCRSRRPDAATGTDRGVFVTVIVYDLEMSVRRKKEQVAEIIEFGAVKVVVRNGRPEAADTFQTFVRPVVSPRLTEDTTLFTGIRQEQVENAPILAEAIRRFTDWIGTTEYYLCSWGPDDRRQLIAECKRHGIPLDWMINHNDLQRLLSKELRLEKHQQIGLMNALEMLGIPFTGSHHRALDDAINTARILLKMYDRLQLKKNRLSEYADPESEVVYSTGHFANQPFAGLSALLAERD